MTEEDIPAPAPPPESTPPRRSARSTKGQHSRFAAEEAEILAAAQTYAALSRKRQSAVPSQPKKKKKAGATHDSSSSNTNTGVGVDSEVVQCICGKDFEGDSQMMAQCEQCYTWQHVKCLYGKEDESLLPEVYFCRNCRPLPSSTSSIVMVKQEQQPKIQNDIQKVPQTNDRNTQVQPKAHAQLNSNATLPLPKKRKQLCTNQRVCKQTRRPTSRKSARNEDSKFNLLRNSVKDAFFDVFSRSLVPTAVVQGYISNPGTFEELTILSEDLSVNLEQVLYDEYLRTKPAKSRGNGNDNGNINRHGNGHKSNSSNGDNSSTRGGRTQRLNETGLVYRSHFRVITEILTAQDTHAKRLHQRIVTGELGPKEFVKMAAGVSCLEENGKVNLEQNDRDRHLLISMAEAVRAEGLRIFSSSVNSTNGKGHDTWKPKEFTRISRESTTVKRSESLPVDLPLTSGNFDSTTGPTISTGNVPANITSTTPITGLTSTTPIASSNITSSASTSTAFETIPINVAATFHGRFQLKTVSDFHGTAEWLNSAVGCPSLQLLVGVVIGGSIASADLGAGIGANVVANTGADTVADLGLPLDAGMATIAAGSWNLPLPACTVTTLEANGEENEKEGGQENEKAGEAGKKAGVDAAAVSSVVKTASSVLSGTIDLKNSGDILPQQQLQEREKQLDQATVGFVINGRIDRLKAGKYLRVIQDTHDVFTFIVLRGEAGRVTKNGGDDILVSAHLQQQTQEDKLFEYLCERDQYGVMDIRSHATCTTSGCYGSTKINPRIKVGYLVPLSVGETIPDYFGSLTDQGRNRLQMQLQVNKKVLVGVLVLKKREE